ncbi:MAG: methyltransferase domain-containing protein [Dehalococcoidales bacterium]|nr:methyltransferase domain-containing protein [Dehalococcoidales bacterium]
MRHDALNYLDLYCTHCRAFDGEVKQHRVMLVPEEMFGDYVVTGWLECTHCGKRYRIIDGVPCFIESFSGDKDLAAQYMDAHYGNINSGYWLEMESIETGGLCLDVGCSVGRYTFQCARDGFAVGIDVNLELLNLATAAQRNKKISYTRKTRALAHAEISSDFSPSDNVLFLLADVLNPPFRMETFDFVSALNLIDSVSNPMIALGQIDAMLKPGGRLFLSTPYAWDAGISTGWLETEELEPHSFVKETLTGKQVAECGFNYNILTERTGIPWYLRKMDSQYFLYYVDVILADKLQAGNQITQL